MQGLRASVGLGSDPDPYHIVENLFSHLPAFKEGRIHPQDLHDAIGFLIASHMPGYFVLHRTEVLDGLDDRRFDWGDVILTDQFTINMVQPGANEFKIVLFGIVGPDGSMIRGHYLLVRDFLGNRIEVIEPNKPETSMSFKLKPLVIEEESLLSVELVPEEDNIFHGRYEPGTRFVLLAVSTAQRFNRVRRASSSE